jgi:hypothetical protein
MGLEEKSFNPIFLFANLNDYLLILNYDKYKYDSSRF